MGLSVAANSSILALYIKVGNRPPVGSLCLLYVVLFFIQIWEVFEL